MSEEKKSSKDQQEGWCSKHKRGCYACQHGWPAENNDGSTGRDNLAGNSRNLASPSTTQTALQKTLEAIRARYEQNAKGYRMGWSEAEGKFGVLGDRQSGGLVSPEKYEQLISALLCCTEDIPWLIEQVTPTVSRLSYLFERLVENSRELADDDSGYYRHLVFETRVELGRFEAAPADTVALSVYESAVRGRQDFRQALVEQRTLNDRLILVLRMIREGVADPKKFAEETLARVSRPATSGGSDGESK